MSAAQSGADRLAAFEAMLAALRQQHADAARQMERLRGEGREKSASFRQLMGRKLQLQEMLAVYEAYGLL